MNHWHGGGHPKSSVITLRHFVADCGKHPHPWANFCASLTFVNCQSGSVCKHAVGQKPTWPNNGKSVQGNGNNLINFFPV